MNMEMKSFFGNLYLDMQKRISEALPQMWIEQDFGQDIYDEWRAAVAYPAFLIDFPDADYSAEAGLSQMGEVLISGRLLVAPFTQSYEGAPIEIKKDALSYFELEQEIVSLLHGWSPDAGYCQPLVRTKSKSDNQNDKGLRIRALSFTTTYEEDFG